MTVICSCAVARLGFLSTLAAGYLPYRGMLGRHWHIFMWWWKRVATNISGKAMVGPKTLLMLSFRTYMCKSQPRASSGHNPNAASKYALQAFVINFMRDYRAWTRKTPQEMNRGLTLFLKTDFSGSNVLSWCCCVFLRQQCREHGAWMFCFWEFRSAFPKPTHHARDLQCTTLLKLERTSLNHTNKQVQCIKDPGFQVCQLLYLDK